MYILPGACFNARMSLNAFLVHKADQYAAGGDTRGIWKMNLVYPLIIQLSED